MTSCRRALTREIIGLGERESDFSGGNSLLLFLPSLFPPSQMKTILCCGTLRTGMGAGFGERKQTTRSVVPYDWGHLQLNERWTRSSPTKLQIAPPANSSSTLVPKLFFSSSGCDRRQLLPGRLELDGETREERRHHIRTRRFHCERFVKYTAIVRRRWLSHPLYYLIGYLPPPPPPPPPRAITATL